jgi:hypothetical protein
MEMRIDEIGTGIYRLSTFVPQIAAPAGPLDSGRAGKRGCPPPLPLSCSVWARLLRRDSRYWENLQLSNSFRMPLLVTRSHQDKRSVHEAALSHWSLYRCSVCCPEPSVATAVRQFARRRLPRLSSGRRWSFLTEELRDTTLMVAIPSRSLTSGTMTEQRADIPFVQAPFV